jgi:hypothetical protein
MARTLEWHTPRSHQEVQRFLGLVQYLANFMPDVTHLTSPLESICKGGQVFFWRPFINIV